MHARAGDTGIGLCNTAALPPDWILGTRDFGVILQHDGDGEMLPILSFSTVRIVRLFMDGRSFSTLLITGRSKSQDLIRESPLPFGGSEA